MCVLCCVRVTSHAARQPLCTGVARRRSSACALLLALHLPASLLLRCCRPLLCTVCQCDCVGGDTLIQLPCSHCYHEDCISQWLSGYSKRCPVCKAEVGGG